MELREEKEREGRSEKLVCVPALALNLTVDKTKMSAYR